MNQRLKCGATWLAVGLLLFKYVYLQLGLINDHLLRWLLVVLLFVVAFFLAGSETALTKIEMDKLALWGIETDEARKALYLKLAQNTGFRKLVNPFKRFRFYLHNSCRTDFWVQNKKINFQDRLSMVIVCNNIININLVIVLAACLVQSSSFLNGARMPWRLPAFGTGTFFDNFLPLAGDAGFSSVGVTVILLFVAELIPKKIAAHNPMGFLKLSTYWLVPLGWLKVPGILAEGLAMPINYACEKLGWPITD